MPRRARLDAPPAVIMDAHKIIEFADATTSATITVCHERQGEAGQVRSPGKHREQVWARRVLCYWALRELGRYL
jgi:hypothetical protein